MDGSGLYTSSRSLPPLQLPRSDSYNNVLPSNNTLPPLRANMSTIQDRRYSSRANGPYDAGSSSHSPIAQLPWSNHSSTSRDDHSHQRSRLGVDDVKRELHHAEQQQQPALPPHPSKQEEEMPTTSDFVKKLYKMLDDKSFANVVSWGPHGDCFVVKDMNEFTKTILPRLFKHSNFASFVRQLNKYDFHKVKNNDDNQFGEQSWTFRHPDFHSDRPDALENIKRKVPTQRKTAQTGRSHPSESPGPSTSASSSSVEALQAQVQRLTAAQDEMSSHVRNLERNYQDVLQEMVQFQRNMAQQDGLMQNLIQYFLQVENEKPKESQSSDTTQFLPTRMMGDTYPEADVARASFAQMNEISRRAEVAGMSFGNANDPSRLVDLLRSGTPSSLSRQEALSRIEEIQRSRSSPGTSSNNNQQASTSSNPLLPADQSPISWDTGNFNAEASGDSPGHEGLAIYTMGHLMPRADENSMDSNWNPQSSGDFNAGPSPAPRAASPARFEETVQPSADTAAGSQTLRVRRSTFVPGWAVPPRVLLVDDDAVSRKLGSKFLQVFGCTIDVAVDGAVAVNKMNLDKYDLVLMDIVMPKLDGVSATNMIRQFDHMTPIISMTSNSKPNEIMRYFQHGMTDILPKPFTKDGLLDMLEKHLMHLKVIQQVSQIPRSPGIPPLSDPSFESALTTQAAALSNFNNLLMPSSSGDVVPSMNSDGIREDDDQMRRINPLAGMGLSDEQYHVMLQSLVRGETFPNVGNAGGSSKRGLDDAGASDGRDGKRSRFEVIE